MAKHPAKCLRCGKVRKCSYRGLCRTCSVWAGKKGTLDDYPPSRPRRTLQDFADDFAVLEQRGLSYMEICEKLGYSTAGGGVALRVMLVRARKAELLPKRTPLCGWEAKRYG